MSDVDILTLQDKMQQMELDERMLNVLMQEFRVGSKHYIIIETHPIFELGKQTQEKHNNTSCHYCDDKESDKLKRCDFCGYNHCKKCVHKTRAFLKATLQVDGTIPRGKICVLCDRRIMLKLTFAQYKNKVIAKGKFQDSAN